MLKFTSFLPEKCTFIQSFMHKVRESVDLLKFQKKRHGGKADRGAIAGVRWDGGQ